MSVFDYLYQIQQQVSKATGNMKVDVYRKAGYGILCVPHGKPLIPQNVIYAIPDFFGEDE